ncbi:MAG: STM4013/SEN3800 family hydrolase [Myxococcaceae bacterium]
MGVVGSHDILFVTLDTLRFDVAVESLARGKTPTLARVLPGRAWEERHTPGTFTFAAHQAFFAGFFPTPARPGKHVRRFALKFAGSESTGEHTEVFDAPDLISGFKGRGYHTLCIGGVGFFNQQNPLGHVLPGFFDEAHWRPELGVTDPRSTEHQVSQVRTSLAAQPASRRCFTFVNVSALHQPNRHYLPGAIEDSRSTHAAALEYVDSCLQPLFATCAARAPLFVIIGSDHGTAYGEDGFHGHRLAHPVVTTVPWAEFELPKGWA